MKTGWASLSRADRRVYGVVVALIVLSVVPVLLGFGARSQDPPTHRHDPARGFPKADEPHFFPGPSHAPDEACRDIVSGSGGPGFLESVASPAAIVLAVALALGWEYVRWCRRKLDSVTAGTEGAGLLSFMIALPVGLPFAGVAAWVAHQVTAKTGEPDILPRFVPTSVSVFVVVYLLTLGGAFSWIAAARARREETL